MRRIVLSNGMGLPFLMLGPPGTIIGDSHTEITRKRRTYLLTYMLQFRRNTCIAFIRVLVYTGREECCLPERDQPVYIGDGCQVPM